MLTMGELALVVTDSGENTAETITERETGDGEHPERLGGLCATILTIYARISCRALYTVVRQLLRSLGSVSSAFFLRESICPAT